MDEKVFIYLRLRTGERLVARSKIREFGGLGSLLVQFLRQTLAQVPEDSLDPERDGVPVLDYVDANSDRPLISFHVDPIQRVQIIRGCIPPAYQGRMLDPHSTTFSVQHFVASTLEDAPASERHELSERLARSQLNLLERIRQTMDADGNFDLQVPLGSR